MAVRPILVFKDFKHQHVSEREKAHFWPDGRHDDFAAEDCLWCSAIEILRFGGLNIPATPQEAEALRAASGEGPTSASNPGQLVVGAKRRYNVTLVKQSSTFETFWKRMSPGHAAVISGKLSAFKPGSTLRRHQPSSGGPHAVAIFRYDDQPRAWWCDPLAVKAEWPGLRVSKAQVQAFMAQLPNPYIIVAHNQFAKKALPVKDFPKEKRPMIQLTFSGVPVGTATSTRIGHAFDLETRAVRTFPKADRIPVIAEIRLAEELSQSLPTGELMLLTTDNQKGRLEVVRALDTDWPAGRHP